MRMEAGCFGFRAVGFYDARSDKHCITLDGNDQLSSIELQISGDALHALASVVASLEMQRIERERD